MGRNPTRVLDISSFLRLWKTAAGENSSLSLDNDQGEVSRRVVSIVARGPKKKNFKPRKKLRTLLRAGTGGSRLPGRQSQVVFGQPSTSYPHSRRDGLGKGTSFLSLSPTRGGSRRRIILIVLGPGGQKKGAASAGPKERTVNLTI